MPLFHTRTFRVRHYECYPYGYVGSAHYLRYMQETAFDAAAAAGYGMRYFDANQHVWLVRETEVEYARPLRFGDSVIIKTWVEDFRRTRSRRAYELTHAQTGEPVARATTDWVYVNTGTSRPATVPAEMVAAFGLSPQSEPAPRPRFPSAPPSPPEVFKIQRKVQWHELDMMGHVNNAMYLDYAADCEIQVLDAHGWSSKQMNDRGFGILIQRHQIEYKQPALPDEWLEIATWVSGIQGTSATRHYTIHRVRDGALLTQIHSRCVWVDRLSGEPVRIPSDFMAAFRANIAGERPA
jgi:acyl-CoA thioester hydrolase